MNTAEPIVYSAIPDSLSAYIRKLWKFRYLIFTFTYQELKTQYSQTYLNWLWIIVRPLMVLGIFVFIFDKLFHVPGLSSPYALFVFTGLAVWNNFSFMINNGGSVVSSNQVLIRKMYFPRLILVFSKALISLVELAISLLLIFVLQLILKHPYQWQVIFLPFFIGLNLLLGVGAAIWLNAFSLNRRDINHFVPNLVGFLIWLTPVFYPATLIPRQFAFFTYLNPIAGIIEGCRWAILGDVFPSLWYLPGFVFCFVFAAAGVVFFARKEDSIADFV